MATSQQWAQAFARQADADFEMFLFLQSQESVRECHFLQFLQMSCEKLVKAHMYTKGIRPGEIESSHRFAFDFDNVLRQQLGATGFSPKRKKHLMRHTKHPAAEIEYLAPSVKRGGLRLDNCEYPWEDDRGILHSPLDWTFLPTQLIAAPTGRTILKLVRRAISNPV